MADETSWGEFVESLIAEKNGFFPILYQYLFIRIHCGYSDTKKCFLAPLIRRRN